MTPEPIGAQLLQTPTEWETRNEILSRRMSELVDAHAPSGAAQGLEVGCQTGVLTDAMAHLTRVPEWAGIDPALTEEQISEGGCRLLPARGSELPFADEAFDVVLFANVYEHIPPAERARSLQEMRRVLRPGGVVVGQLPNPYFPIESHSRLPFMGWLPISWQKRYWKLSPVSWEHDFWSVTIRHLTRNARANGLEVALTTNFNYPPEVIPSQVRWAARALERPMRRLPWAWQFVLRRPG